MCYILQYWIIGVGISSNIHISEFKGKLPRLKGKLPRLSGEVSGLKGRYRDPGEEPGNRRRKRDIGPLGGNWHSRNQTQHCF